MNAKLIKYEQQKICASTSMYFSLFDKHIPNGLNETSSILLYRISNIGCIARIIDCNPRASYTIVENDYINAALKLVLDSSASIKFTSNFHLENQPSYDLIVTNLLDVNKHRQQVVECIKHLKDENSLCIALTLIGWLSYGWRHVDNDNSFYAFEESLAKHIVALEHDNFYGHDSITKNHMQEHAVMCVKKSAMYDFYKRIYGDFIIPEKYVPFMERLISQIVEEDNFSRLKYYGKWSRKLENYVVMDGIRSRHCRIDKRVNAFKTYCGYFANKINEKGLTYSKASNKNSDIKKIRCAAFNTSEEVKNCYKSMQTKFAMFILAAFYPSKEFIPWQDDYSHPWTDIDFCKHYNVSDDEWQWIDSMINRYRGRKTL